MAMMLAAAAALSAMHQANAARGASLYNAQVAQGEQKLSVDQANAQEGIVRHQTREALGRQAAAFGASGVGYGGSSETSLDQSAVNQELDALNTRYKGSVTGWGYGAQSALDTSRAQSEGQSGAVMAGTALLKGLGGYYSFAPQTPSQQAGTTSQ